jgi:hypothetical protein
MSLVVNEKLGGLENSHISSLKSFFIAVKQTIMRFLNTGAYFKGCTKRYSKKEANKIIRIRD